MSDILRSKSIPVLAIVKNFNESQLSQSTEAASPVGSVNQVRNVIQELRKNHPYEELEIDIIPLINEIEFR